MGIQSWQEIYIYWQDNNWTLEKPFNGSCGESDRFWLCMFAGITWARFKGLNSGETIWSKQWWVRLFLAFSLCMFLVSSEEGKGLNSGETISSLQCWWVRLLLASGNGCHPPQWLIFLRQKLTSAIFLHFNSTQLLNLLETPDTHHILPQH